nr:VP3 [JC polyomavirus]
MALQLFNPEDYYDILFPGVNAFVNNIHYLDPRHWGPSLFSTISQAFWNLVRDDLPSLTSQEIQRRTQKLFVESLARFLEETTWAIVNSPVNLYNYISDYYSRLSPVRPSMVRQVAQREGTYISFGHSYTQSIDDADIEKSLAPGGANQRSAPQWMLPLLLGLYGTVTPALEAYEDGPNKKKRRKEGPRASSKTSYKRRSRSSRS